MKLERAERWALALTAVFVLVTGGVQLRRRASAPDFSAETAEVEIEVSRTAGLSQAAETPEPAARPVNINTAGPEELASLDGVGEVLAARIVEYREAHGPFAAVEALTEVKGIGTGILERNRDRVTVGEGGAEE